MKIYRSLWYSGMNCMPCIRRNLYGYPSECCSGTAKVKSKLSVHSVLSGSGYQLSACASCDLAESAAVSGQYRKRSGSGSRRLPAGHYCRLLYKPCQRDRRLHHYLLRLPDGVDRHRLRLVCQHGLLQLQKALEIAAHHRGVRDHRRRSGFGSDLGAVRLRVWLRALRAACPAHSRRVDRR